MLAPSTEGAVKVGPDDVPSPLGAAPSPSPWAYRVPLLVAALLIALINGVNLDRWIRAANPRNYWESAEVVEAWRSARGMPVYDPSPDGHATHMYGALAPWAQGMLFRWIGPSNQAGRLLSLGSALVTVTLLAALCGGGSPWTFVVGWALVFGLNYRCGDYFAENRPDTTALMFAVFGLLLIGLGQERRRAALVLLGSGCLAVGFFFKQPAAAFAAVPPVALVLRWRRPSRAEAVLALTPLAIMAVVILALKLFAPVVFHYMIAVPRAYALNWSAVARVGWEFLLDSPLFLLLLGEWLLREGGTMAAQRRLRWVVAALLVLIPFSAMMMGKVGGTNNSQLPALLAMSAFCILRLAALAASRDLLLPSLPARLLGGGFLAVLMLMTAFPHPTRKRGLLVARTGQGDAYRSAVAVAGSLPGLVVSPEDPTIPLFAKGYAGRNLACEYDSHPEGGQWAGRLPEGSVDELRRADYLIDLRPLEFDLLTDAHLEALGFERLPMADLDPTYYGVWRRKPTGAGRAAVGVAPSVSRDPVRPAD